MQGGLLAGPHLRQAKGFLKVATQIMRATANGHIVPLNRLGRKLSAAGPPLCRLNPGSRLAMGGGAAVRDFVARTGGDVGMLAVLTWNPAPPDHRSLRSDQVEGSL